MFEKLKPKILPLSRFEKKISPGNSNIEEGLFTKIFEILPAQNHFVVEMGAGDGLNFSLSKNLIKNFGWKALLIEGDPHLGKLLNNRYKKNLEVQTEAKFVTAENIESLFQKNNVPQNLDLLCIDVDGNDYYIWRALNQFKPLILCIEYNASIKPGLEFSIDYDPEFLWRGDDYYGASITTFIRLGREKGYELLHCTSRGENLLFVKKEFFELFKIQDNSDESFYQLPQYGKYGRAHNGKGHRLSPKNTKFYQRWIRRVYYYLSALPRKWAVREYNKERKGSYRNVD